MSTPLPGQIRCPTCHRSTPPAAFCTQCGTAIQDSARARPRGLDRDELQDRIRTHRPGDAAFRRGSQVGGGVDPGPSVYRPYQPEPEDELVLPGAAADEGTPARVDNTPPNFDEPPPVIAPPPAPVQPPPLTPPAPTPAAAVKPRRREPQPAPWKPAPPSATPPPPPPPIVPVAAPEPEWSAPDEPYGTEPDSPDYRYRNRGDDWERRDAGMSPLAIGGFVLLGVLAIGVGAVMAGLFSGGVAGESPSPTPLVSSLPSVTAEPSLAPSTGPSVPASLGPTVSPTAVPDGFTARTEPCVDQPASQDGCGSSGSTVNSGSVWVWVGWR
ncbi:MAG: hypothetical protein ACXWWU_04995, partial [Candidatus Limnocylindria bacterium]